MKLTKCKDLPFFRWKENQILTNNSKLNIVIQNGDSQWLQ